MKTLNHNFRSIERINKQMEKYCEANFPKALNDEVEAYVNLETEDEVVWRLYDCRSNESYKVILNRKTKKISHEIFNGDIFARV